MLIEYGVWGSRLVLAGAFGLLTWGKLADGPATRKALLDFGIGIRWVPAVAIGLPAAEGLVAAGLLLPWTAAVAGAASALPLAAFTAVIARLLLRGEHPHCSCFGAATSAPIGPAMLVRNGLLLALAGLVTVGALRYPRVPADLPVEVGVGLALIVTLAVVLIWTLGQVRALRRRVDEQALSTLGAEGLPVGAVAPEFELPAAEGGRIDLVSLLAPGKGVLLVFVHPGARCARRWHASCPDGRRGCVRRRRSCWSVTAISPSTPRGAVRKKWAISRFSCNRATRPRFAIGSGERRRRY
ncbi:MauE/DoxX family redox-associated membrane protein [Nocardia fluminea]|uniref:MauE/DoxX family redox-associated membrane protein n=1 Tax=Nocardia fluminea TaxID=134984 RepID=UPI003D126EE2